MSNIVYLKLTNIWTSDISHIHHPAIILRGFKRICYLKMFTMNNVNMVIKKGLPHLNVSNLLVHSE